MLTSHYGPAQGEAPGGGGTPSVYLGIRDHVDSGFLRFDC